MDSEISKLIRIIGVFLILIIIVVVWISVVSSSSTSTRFDVYYKNKPITSNNWTCTEDCSGHEAGYEWAGENGITDPDDCDGNSDSFIEGCEAYANEYQSDYEEEYYY